MMLTDNDYGLGKYIEVEFLYNADQASEVVYETTLAELKDMKPEAVEERVFDEILDEGGLGVGDEDDLVTKFNFVDNDKDQFQGGRTRTGMAL